MNKLLIPIIATALFVSVITVHAAETLMITPTRIILDGREREAKVTLTNTGDETGEYRLFFVNYKMTEDGSFELITTHTGKSAADMLRFSPKQVVLPPGTTQTARIVLRKPAGLATGEYRSHLVFQAVPKQAAITRSEGAKGRASAQFTTLYGISIPVIVRHDTTSAKAAIGDVKTVELNGKTWLELKLLRTGSASVYGDLSVTQKREDKDVTLAESNGVAVYTDLAERIVRIPLEEAPKGNLHVTFRDPATQKVFAEKDVEVR